MICVFCDNQNHTKLLKAAVQQEQFTSYSRARMSYKKALLDVAALKQDFDWRLLVLYLQILVMDQNLPKRKNPTISSEQSRISVIPWDYILNPVTYSEGFTAEQADEIVNSKNGITGLFEHCDYSLPWVSVLTCISFHSIFVMSFVTICHHLYFT